MVASLRRTSRLSLSSGSKRIGPPRQPDPPTREKQRILLRQFLAQPRKHLRTILDLGIPKNELLGLINQPQNTTTLTIESPVVRDAFLEVWHEALKNGDQKPIQQGMVATLLSIHIEELTWCPQETLGKPVITPQPGKRLIGEVGTSKFKMSINGGGKSYEVDIHLTPYADQPGHGRIAIFDKVSTRGFGSSGNISGSFMCDFGPRDLLVFRTPDSGKEKKENLHAFRIGYWNPTLARLLRGPDQDELANGLLEMIKNGGHL